MFNLDFLDDPGWNLGLAESLMFSTMEQWYSRYSVRRLELRIFWGSRNSYTTLRMRGKKLIVGKSRNANIWGKAVGMDRGCDFNRLNTSYLLLIFWPCRSTIGHIQKLLTFPLSAKEIWIHNSVELEFRYELWIHLYQGRIISVFGSRRHQIELPKIALLPIPSRSRSDMVESMNVLCRNIQYVLIIKTFRWLRWRINCWLQRWLQPLPLEHEGGGINTKMRTG
jgi:hypothetical protein